MLAIYGTVTDAFGEKMPALSNDADFGSYQSLGPASLIFDSLQFCSVPVEYCFNQLKYSPMSSAVNLS
jgi:hypothetical protein